MFPGESQTTLLGRSQKMLRTVTSVERYHRYKIEKVKDISAEYIDRDIP